MSYCIGTFSSLQTHSIKLGNKQHQSISIPTKYLDEKIQFWTRQISNVSSYLTSSLQGNNQKAAHQPYVLQIGRLLCLKASDYLAQVPYVQIVKKLMIVHLRFFLLPEMCISCLCGGFLPLPFMLCFEPHGSSVYILKLMQSQDGNNTHQFHYESHVSICRRHQSFLLGEFFSTDPKPEARFCLIVLFTPLVILKL